MFHPVEVRALSNYRIWVKYADGVQGEVDLSYLVGKGVFSIWTDRKKFEKVEIGEAGELMWGDDVDLCPDSVYLKISGKSPDEVFPASKESHA